MRLRGPGRFSRRSLGGLVLAVLVALPNVAGAQVVFFPLSDLEGEEFRSGANQIARDGSVVVGVGTSTASGANGREAFTWDADNGSVALGFLSGGASNSIAHAASNDAEYVVGESSSQLSGSNATEAFRYDVAQESFEPLGDLPGGASSSVAYAVSSDGTVVVGGSSSSSSGSQREEAFLWTAASGNDPAEMIALGFLSLNNSSAFGVSGDGSIVVGATTSTMTGPNLLEAFRWTAEDDMESLGELTGGSYLSYARAISTDGTTIVGGSSSTASGAGLVEAFVWTEETDMQPLGDLPTGLYDSEALAVNGDGTLIGGRGSTDSGGGDTAFIWDEVFDMRAVKDVVEDAGVDLGTWRLTQVTGISDDGRYLVGTGINPSGFEEGWAVDLPEPGALLLQGAVVAGMAWAARRRCRRR